MNEDDIVKYDKFQQYTIMGCSLMTKILLDAASSRMEATELPHFSKNKAPRESPMEGCSSYDAP